MVWWIDTDRYCVCRSKFFHYATSVDILNDRIFQTTNIMYSLSDQNYNAYEIHSLTKSGVNVFNVDRTVHEEEFFQDITEVVIASEFLPEMHQSRYPRSIGLTVTMTPTKLVDIDERVDTIIVKDVNNSMELLDFKKKIDNNSLPVMLWIKSEIKENLSSMIQFSDGVFLDLTDISTVTEYNLDIINFCKQAYKPIFCGVNDIIQKYQSLNSEDMHILAIAKQIIRYQFDGVMVIGGKNDYRSESALIQSLVRAFEVAEKESICCTDVYSLSFQIKTPVLPWIATSLAASLAAKQCGASAIIVLTTSGMSARWIANVSPPCYIIAVTTREKITRRLHFYRKVIPLFYKQTFAANWSQECWNRVVFGSTMALQIGLCEPGNKVVILAPFDQDTRYCNSLQILTLPLRCEDSSSN